MRCVDGFPSLISPTPLDARKIKGLVASLLAPKP